MTLGLEQCQQVQVVPKKFTREADLGQPIWTGLVPALRTWARDDVHASS